MHDLISNVSYLAVTQLNLKKEFYVKKLFCFSNASCSYKHH